MASSTRISAERTVTSQDARPFVVHAAALRRVAGTTRTEQRRGVIDGLGTMSVVVPEGAPVAAEVTLSSYPGGIMATGTVSAPWTGECRRCGGVVSGAVEARVRERFVPAGRLEGADRSHGGSDGGSDDVYVLTDDLLDLEPLARDAVLLELPLAPLCSEGCKGLCGRCGANLNLESCACKDPIDPRWSALDQLRDIADGGLA
jgi:uncharacterized protein